jgi:hypothetical protein
VLQYFIGNVQWLDALKPPLEAHLKSIAQVIKLMVTRSKVDSESGAVVSQGNTPAAPSTVPTSDSLLRDKTAVEGPERRAVPYTGFAKAEAELPALRAGAKASETKPVRDAVFISYRRQDSQHITGRIYDRIAMRFGRELVFKDVDSIPLGLDFREHIREHVGRCAVLVAVIGKNWNPPAASGQPRLVDPRDHLRIEIESALERSIPVIPVLVDGIQMPLEEELPPSLVRLAYRNGISVRPDPDFHHDMDRLVRGIEQLLK